MEGVSVRRPDGWGMRSPRRWLAWELWWYVGKFTVRVMFLCARMATMQKCPCIAALFDEIRGICGKLQN